MASHLIPSGAGKMRSMGYPNLLRRYLASVIDTLTVLFLVYLC